MTLHKVNIKFFIFILLISVCATYFLYTKHNIGNDSSISEWLINYQGGFTRRGLTGEISIFISNFFDFPLRKSIFLLQTTIHLSFLVLIFYYLKNIRLNIIQTFALYAPIFLLYSVAEIEALGRKEVLLFLFFIISLIFSEKKYPAKIVNIFVFVTFPLMCLVWEQVILFSPFIGTLLIIKNNFKSFKESFSKLLIIFFPSILSILFIFINPLSAEGHKAMCEFLINTFNERCYMSANLLVLNTIYFSTFDVVHSNANIQHYIRYIVIFFIGFFPLNLLVLKNNFLSKKNFITKNFNLKYLFFLLYLPSILLFVYGYDWGRWVNITYSFSILFYFYLIKNKLITNNLSYQNFLLNRVFNKKSLIIFLFIFYAFGWNPKTVLTGDVASFPGYRIPYKIFKIVGN